MNELKENIIKAMRAATIEKKEVCRSKNIDFYGLYFRTILEYLAKIDSKYDLSQKSLADKIKSFFSRRKIKKMIEHLHKEGVVKITLNGGGFLFTLNKGYE
ncbi:MAG: hypothetical protein C4522_17930 [Desulfobacteraceae bacterium]|nr:MAG: hypothetical protein C4522_17930 [Desulfobacteraceae bacterium]